MSFWYDAGSAQWSCRPSARTTLMNEEMFPEVYQMSLPLEQPDDLLVWPLVWPLVGPLELPLLGPPEGPWWGRTGPARGEEVLTNRAGARGSEKGTGGSGGGHAWRQRYTLRLLDEEFYLFECCAAGVRRA